MLAPFGPSKDAVRQGKADGLDACASNGLAAGCDPCKEFGWYGDTVCDDALIDARVCAGPDPDCEESCRAELAWLQKDAYKETAGRSTAAWPPHTTMTLEVRCTSGGVETLVASVVQENHGTKPGTKDANGDEILVEVKRSAPVAGSRERLLKLVASFESCECAPATAFLSLDTMGDEVMEKVLTTVVGYVQEHLECSAPSTTEQVVTLLQSRQFDSMMKVLANCAWADGSSWEAGLLEASSVVVGQLGHVLDDYHVCNNDAKLQVVLWEAFERTGATAQCDNTNAVCRGPLFFYEP